MKKMIFGLSMLSFAISVNGQTSIKQVRNEKEAVATIPVAATHSVPSANVTATVNDHVQAVAPLVSPEQRVRTMAPTSGENGKNNTPQSVKDQPKKK